VGRTFLSDQSRAVKSAEAGASESLAEICAFHLHDAAHFVQSRPHAFANAVAKGLAAGSALGTRKV
jgi:hypothetical protein